MNHRQLLSESIAERFREVCDQRIGSLHPVDFSDESGFVSKVKLQFNNASITSFLNRLPSPGNSWQQSEPEGLAAMRALAVDELVVTGSTKRPDSCIQELKTTRNDKAKSFELLKGRYACPLNFTGPGEDDVREFVLESLMVRDRRRSEEASLASTDHDYLWYRLNLIAVYSQVSSDLRFLDALNYYHELIPSDWCSRSPNNWLFVSYLTSYARALAARCEDLKCE